MILFQIYLVGLITTTLPPKFRSLLWVVAIIAAATAPPAASSKAANAPPCNAPNEAALVNRVQRVPGAAWPAVSCDPAAIGVALSPVRRVTLPPCEATIVLPHSTSTINE